MISRIWCGTDPWTVTKKLRTSCHSRPTWSANRALSSAKTESFNTLKRWSRKTLLMTPRIPRTLLNGRTSCPNLAWIYSSRKAEASLTRHSHTCESNHTSIINSRWTGSSNRYTTQCTRPSGTTCWRRVSSISWATRRPSVWLTKRTKLSTPSTVETSTRKDSSFTIMESSTGIPPRCPMRKAWRWSHYRRVRRGPRPLSIVAWWSVIQPTTIR